MFSLGFRELRISGLGACGSGCGAECRDGGLGWKMGNL